MIKVLQIGMTSNLGGLETYLRAQYRMLDRNIIRYDFINLNDGAPIIFENEIKANGDKIYSVIKRRINPNMAQELIDNGYDITKEICKVEGYYLA
jgi:hypothetical protein